MRRKIIAGNWKMNKTPSEAVALVNELKDLVKNDEVDVVYCVPAIDIVPVVEAVKGTNVKVGAENMYFEESGAYTGEISAAMLKDAGVEYVIIGHSERRDYFKEDDVLLNKKVKKAIEAGKPANLVDTIAQGALKKYYNENTLLDQLFVKDNKLTIAQYLQAQSKSLTVTSFKRVTLKAE